MNPAAVKTVATEATISPKGVGSPIAIVQTVAVILRHHSPIFPYREPFVPSASGTNNQA